MKATLLMVAACCVFAAAAQETQQEHGRRVVNEALQALGGDAFLHMQNRIETGRAYGFYNQQLAGLDTLTVYTTYLKPSPGKMELRERQAFGKNTKKNQDENGVLITEDNGWEFNYHGARPMDPERLAEVQENRLLNIFYILRMRLDEPGLVCYFMGSDRFESQPVNIVDITDSANHTVTVYFNPSTHLPMRQVFKRRNPTYHDFDSEVTAFDKYRPLTGGVMWPYDVRRERNGQKVSELYADSVEINQEIPAEMFQLPPKMKIIQKGKK
jgi:hypothetical protein